MGGGKERCFQFVRDAGLEIGQAASLLRDLPPAGEVVRQIVREYDEALPTLGRLGPL